jgi:GGDEF domain-containing protein
MANRPPRQRSARPVADAPVDALVVRAEDLAKGWLLGLLEDAPLEDAPGILAAELARDGPRVCAAVVQALASDDDLQRLEPGGALEGLAARAGSFAGGRDGESICRVIDALGAVIWAAVRDELARPDPDQVAELAERLSLVIELVRRAAMRAAAGERSAGAGVVSQAVVPGPDPEPSRGFSVGRVSDSRSDMGSGSLSWPPEKARGEVSGAGTGAGAGSGSGAGAGAFSRGRSGDARSRDPLWLGALDDEVVRAERLGTPLSLLLVELEDAERVLAADGAREAAATFGRFAQAVRGAARRQDLLACESDARAWVIARDTPRPGARALGRRIVSAVQGAQPWRGAPLTVNLGVAVFGEDGRDGERLIRAAEEAMFAAAAGGSDIADEIANGAGDVPGGPGPEFVG